MNALLGGELVGRLDLDVPDRHRVGDLEPDVAIDAGVGEVVDLPAEGRDFRILTAVDAHRDEIGAVPQQAGQARRERRVAVLVRGDLLSVKPDDGVGHRPVEDQFDLTVGEICLPVERALVAERLLETTLVEVVHREVDGVVRQPNPVSGNESGDHPRREFAVEGPTVIELRERSHRCSFI